MSNTPENKSGMHMSDCALHNAPAMPVGPCDCTPILVDQPYPPACPKCGWILEHYPGCVAVPPAPMHDAASCAERWALVQEAVYVLRQQAAAAHDIPRRDLLDDVLAILLDAAEGKAPEGGAG